MSLNTAHANNGVLIHAGEHIILFSDNVAIDWSGQDGAVFKGTKTGKIYLTTHRIIFNNRLPTDPMLSFSMPFVCLTDVEVEQPVFGANNIRGKVRAQANGQFLGEAKFKMVFKSGGAIDFAQCALKAAYICKKYGGPAVTSPPPYCAPTGAWHQAPPPAYSVSPAGYYGWVPASQMFPSGPPANTVFMNDQPPPYPGIVVPGQEPTANGYAGGPPSYPGNGGLPGYPGQQQPAGGYGAPQPAQYGVYPQMPGQQPPQGAYGGYPAAGPPSYNGYPAPGPPQYGGYPPQQPAAYGGASGPFAGPAAGPSGGPAMGFGGSSSKEQEAAQSAANWPPQPPSNVQPNAPPPPEYNEPPPSYNSLSNKKSQ